MDKKEAVNNREEKFNLRVDEVLKAGGKLLGIRLLDHIIIGENKYYSFSDNKKLSTEHNERERF